MNERPRILLGVTVDDSLMLMSGFPEFLAERGWDVHVVSAPGPRLEALKSLRGISAHEIPMVRDPSPLADLRSFLAWLQLLNHLKPDVISVGTPKAGMFGSLAGFLTRVPRRIYHLRGLRLETECGARRLVFSLIEKLTMTVSTQVLSVSASLRQRSVDLRLVRGHKVVVLGKGSSNGVDIQRFEKACVSGSDVAALKSKLGLTADSPVVGFVGRLGRAKGLGVLAEARAILAEREIDYQLLVIGDVDDESGADSLKKLELCGRKPVTAGRVHDVAPYYGLMDVMCLPTLREGFPNVVLEASAAGLPTVTTNATGAVDSVVHGETGLIVEVNSASDLAESLAQMISNPELRLRMGRAARARVVANFDRRAVWSKTERFYRAQIQRRGSDNSAQANGRKGS